MMKWLWKEKPVLDRIVLGWILIVNLITAAAYAIDKRAAQHGQRRIPERTLYLLNLAGGVVGAWLVFFGMRHKTRHLSFWIVQSLCTVLYIAVTIWILVPRR
jgi:uncharacterized membrane protein YsdA (DUF1294 family)